MHFSDSQNSGFDGLICAMSSLIHHDGTGTALSHMSVLQGLMRKGTPLRGAGARAVADLEPALVRAAEVLCPEEAFHLGIDRIITENIAELALAYMSALERRMCTAGPEARAL